MNDVQVQELQDISLAREVLTRDGMGRELRQRCHVTLHEAARAIPCDPSVLSRWERSLSKPTGGRAIAYGELLRLWLREVAAFGELEDAAG